MRRYHIHWWKWRVWSIRNWQRNWKHIERAENKQLSALTPDISHSAPINIQTKKKLAGKWSGIIFSAYYCHQFNVKTRDILNQERSHGFQVQTMSIISFFNWFSENRVLLQKWMEWVSDNLFISYSRWPKWDLILRSYNRFFIAGPNLKIYKCCLTNDDPLCFISHIQLVVHYS